MCQPDEPQDHSRARKSIANEGDNTISLEPYRSYTAAASKLESTALSSPSQINSSHRMREGKFSPI